MRSPYGCLLPDPDLWPDQSYAVTLIASWPNFDDVQFPSRYGFVIFQDLGLGYTLPRHEDPPGPTRAT
jgi:hypothetical protein